ncbi:MAG: 1-deoxy-D-xylulose-5-phosphate reductoisomerase [Firmicutes bacterium]|jgi:1-deoxy-D-xylulose-5-phosphate reductoisomerase|nr:1-deoxy-D-xylulose-5-phosphate reductoisomerase [Bacillota bacterium]
MKTVTVLGATGSIGTQALSLLAANKERYSVYALTANTRVAELARQARALRPQKVVIADPARYGELKLALRDTATKVEAGLEAVSAVAAEKTGQLVLNALVGFAGLAPTLAALAAGNTVALANKESLVAGGHLVMPLAARREYSLLPVDSEHSAIFQCLQGQDKDAVEEVILTASGGPFRGRRREELAGVTPEEALRHPNWKMGAKITVDSATMMNKGLEVIEAHWLFALDYAKIKVIIHRESIIHSLVVLRDGAVLAQLGMPDMRVPIGYALSYPERLAGTAPRINWKTLRELHFEQHDTESFPCLALAYEAGKAGGSMPAVLNAANEEAVKLFLAGHVRFLDIPRIIETVMNKHKVIPLPDYTVLVETDRQARRLARECAGKRG